MEPPSSRPSPPAIGAPKGRLVGSIVDPAADDGFSLSGPGAPGGFGAQEHPIKAKLLARARAARGETDDEPADRPSPRPAPTVGLRSNHRLSSSDTSEQPAPPPALPPIEREPLHTPPPGAVASELDKIARRAQGPVGASKLSPNMTALLGALLGLTVVGTLGIFLGQFEPDRPTQVDEAAERAPKEAKAETKPVEPKREKIQGPWRIEDAKGEPGKKILSGKVGKEPFLRAIQNAGLPKGQAYRAYTALKDQLDLDHCDASDQFLALVEGSDKTLVAFEYIRSKEEVFQAKAGDDGLLSGGRLDLQVARNQVRRALNYDGKSFEESARQSGFDPGLSSVIEDAFRGHLSTSELEQGDQLRVIAQEVTVLGEFSRYAGVEAVEVLRRGKDPLRIYYYPHAVEGGYFDKNGRAPYEGGWRKPIPTAPVTSKFNMKRMHPVLNKVMPHTGTDFGAPAGTPIGSTAPGTVSFIGPAGASGNLVKVRHHDGYESGYAHLSKFAEGLSVGDKVDRLQLVGYCGSTGRSTGPHLHFTMKKDGKFIDPESLNLDGMRVLPPSHRPAFAEVRQKYDPVLDAIELPEVTAPPPEEKPAVESPGGDESDGADDSPSDNPMIADERKTAPSAAPAAQPKEQKAAPPSRGTPAQAQKATAIFLTDQELLKMQAATDDGEVSP